MSEEVRLWKVDSGDQLCELRRESLNLEIRLQEWLVQDISVLDPGLMVIGREVETDFGGYIDLLCMDEVGDLVVVELKRNKTPREVTAQALDYGSWVVNLSNERIRTIADTHFRQLGLDEEFRNRFQSDIPDTLNSGHRIIIVGARFDESSERIIKYLSDTHGVNINAATFGYFRSAEGAEFLARVFLVEPSQVDFQSRTKGTSKRRPNLTYQELEQVAEESGVQHMYQYAVSALERVLQKQTTRTSIAFAGNIEGSRKVIISLTPGQSSEEKGLRYQLYKNRLAQFLRDSQVDARDITPASHEYWIAFSTAGKDGEGLQGYIQSDDEIDRLVKALEACN